MLYFADGRWWEWHDKGIARTGLTAAEVQQRFREFAGIKVTIWSNESYKVTDEAVFRLRNVDGSTGDPVLSAEPNGLATGRNSGYQAVNFAVLAGAARIVLLGYDMQMDKQAHWFGDHPVATHHSTVAMFRNGFQKLARRMPAGLEIINCSAQTALTCFPRGSLESVLPDPAAAVVSA